MSSRTAALEIRNLVFVAQQNAKTIKEQERAAEAHAKEVARRERESAKEAERAARDKVRTAESAEQQKTKVLERAEKQRQLIIDNSAMMAGRVAAKQAAEELRIEEQKLRKIQSIRNQFARALGHGAAAGVVGGIRNAAGVTSGLVSGVLGLGGGFSLSGAVQTSLDFDRQAQVLANISKANGRSYSKESIVNAANSIFTETNVKRADAMAGLTSFADISGNLGVGMRSAGFAAKVAKGQGADFRDVMKTLGTLSVENSGLDQAGLENMLSGIVGGARIGSISTADMAKTAGKTASTAGVYSGDLATNQRHLLGMAQLVAPVVGGSAAESATVVTRLGSDLAANAKKIKTNLGVDITGADGRLKGLQDILPAMMEASKGNEGALKHAGINRESIKAFRALSPTFFQGDENGIGAEGVRNKINKFQDASVGREEIEKNFRDVLTTTAEKVDHALEQLSKVAGDKLMPQMEKLIPVITNLIPTFGKFLEVAGPAFGDLLKTIGDFVVENQDMVNTLAANPIGTIIALNVAKSITQAAIGETLRNLLSGSVGGVIGAFGAIAIAGYAAAKAIDAMIEQENIKERKRIASQITMQNAADILKHPENVNKETIARAQEVLSQGGAAISAEEKSIAQKRADREASKNLAGTAFEKATGLGEAKDLAMQNREAELKRQKDSMKDLTIAVAEATAHLNKLSAAADAANPTAPHRNGPVAPPLKGGPPH